MCFGYIVILLVTFRLPLFLFAGDIAALHADTRWYSSIRFIRMSLLPAGDETFAKHNRLWFVGHIAYFRYNREAKSIKCTDREINKR